VPQSLGGESREQFFIGVGMTTITSARGTSVGNSLPVEVGDLIEFGRSDFNECRCGDRLVSVAHHNQFGKPSVLCKIDESKKKLSPRGMYKVVSIQDEGHGHRPSWIADIELAEEI